MGHNSSKYILCYTLASKNNLNIIRNGIAFLKNKIIYEKFIDS